MEDVENPGNPAEAGPVFVLSTGRCGSTMLARVLDQDPRISAFHEPEPLLLREAYLRWRSDRNSEWAIAKIRRKREERIAHVRGRGRVYVESSCFLAHLVEELEQSFDTPRFIHLFRDGRAFVRTGLDLWWYEDVRPPDRLARRIRRTLGVPVGRVWEDHKLDPPDGLSTRFEKIAWLWTEINADIIRGLRSIPEDRRSRLRLESFDEDRLCECIRFCVGSSKGAPLKQMWRIAESRPNSTDDRSVPRPARWSPERKSRFEEIAGEMMRELGYRRGRSSSVGTIR